LKKGGKEPPESQGDFCRGANGMYWKKKGGWGNQGDTEEKVGGEDI